MNRHTVVPPDQFSETIADAWAREQNDGVKPEMASPQGLDAFMPDHFAETAAEAWAREQNGGVKPEMITFS